MKRWPALVPLWLVIGCFPYREAYRPAVTGVVLDEDGRPVAGVAVVTCSESSWIGLHATRGCPRPGSTRTAADGSFSLSRLTEWTWCCLGEAPLPITAAAACAMDRGIGGALVDRQGPVRIQLLPPPVFRASHRAGGLRGAPDAGFFVAVCDHLDQVRTPPP